MYKTKLQELCHQRRWGLPRYSAMKDGPDHMPSFKASVFVNGVTFTSPGAFSSSKEAHNQAAMLAFQSFSSAPPGSSTPTAEYVSKEEVRAARHRDSPIPAHSSVVIDDTDHLCKSQLQNYAQRNNLDPPNFTIKTEGPPHDTHFKAIVVIDGKSFESPTFFSTIKEAEQAAAKIALMSLSVDIFQKPNILGDSCQFKSLLLELTQREGFCKPTYNTTQFGSPHMPTFFSTVELEGEEFHGKASKSKKQAEQDAAKIAYIALKEWAHHSKGKGIRIKSSDKAPDQTPLQKKQKTFARTTTPIGRTSTASTWSLRPRRCISYSESGKRKDPDDNAPIEIEDPSSPSRISKSTKSPGLSQQEVHSPLPAHSSSNSESQDRSIHALDDGDPMNEEFLEQSLAEVTWPQPQVDQPSSSSVAFEKLLENNPLAVLSQLLEDIPSHSSSGIMTHVGVGIGSSSHKESAQPLLEELRSLAFSSELPLPKLLSNKSKLRGRIQDLLDQLHSGHFELSSNQLEGIATFKKLFESSISYIQRSRDFVTTQHELEAKRQIAMKELHLAQIELSKYKMALKAGDDKVAIINQNIDTIQAQINIEPESQKLKLQGDIAKLRRTCSKCLEKKDLLQQQVKTLSVKAEQLMDEEAELMVEETELVQELQKIEADYAVMASNPSF